MIHRTLAYHILTFLLSITLHPGEASKPIELWPAAAPGEKGDIGEEKDVSKPNEGLVAGKPLLFLN